MIFYHVSTAVHPPTPYVRPKHLEYTVTSAAVLQLIDYTLLKFSDAPVVGVDMEQREEDEDSPRYHRGVAQVRRHLNTKKLIFA